MAEQYPDHQSLAHARQEEAARICRDAYDGPLRIRKAGKLYLPQFPRESDAAYQDRLNTSVFYDAYARTVDGLTGLVFRKPPVLDPALPDELHRLWENIDGEGTHGEVFMRDRHRDGEIDGHFLIFVDRPKPPAVRNRAQERAVGGDPYWIGIRKQQVVGFRTENIGGKTVLTHFRYKTVETEPDGQYGEKEVTRVREYNLGAGGVTYAVHAHRENERGEVKWVVEEEGPMAIDEIPLAVGYVGEKCGTLESKPPHLALALENIKHYQLTSDNDNVLHLTSVPQLAIFGSDPEGEQEVSAHGAWKFTNAEARMEYVEPEGKGLDAARARIEKSEHRMAVLGLSTLMSETRAAETATSKRINKAENDSALSNHARSTQDAGEEAIRLTAKWLSLNLPDKGVARWLTINNDFEHLPIDAQMVSALANLVAVGKLTQETMWAVLQRGELLPEDFDAEREAEMLEAEIGVAFSMPEAA